MRLSRGIGLLALVACLGCEPEPVGIEVDLRTDLAVGPEVSELRLVLQSADLTDEQVVPLSLSDDYLEGARVASFDAPPGVYQLDAIARQRGVDVIMQSLAIEVDQDRIVTVLMTRSCATVSCDAGSTCRGGRCQAMGCSEQTPELCEAAACATDAECGGDNGCETSRCVIGECFVWADSSRCAGTEWCAVGGLCEEQSTDPDCLPSVADADTVALYRFDADPGTGALLDEVGAHAGIAPAPRWVVGPDGCGTALGFTEEAPATYVPDSTDFDLVEGSVDFFVRAGPDVSGAIFSREEGGNSTYGHFTVWVEERTLRVRLQRLDGWEYNCFEAPISDGAWHHVGINFGPPELEVFVDGTARDPVLLTAEETATELPRDEPVAATGLASPTGDVNRNPLYFGASRAFSDGPADLGPGSSRFVDGAIDMFRISRVRRDFTR